MAPAPTRIEGIYYNSADMPVFLEDRHVGGHDYVYLEGFLRIPGHFVEVKDPAEDPNAPESFRIAYEQMLEKGRAEKRETHKNTTSRKHNVIPMDQEVPDAGPEPEPEDEAEDEPKPARKRTARKGSRESTTKDDSSQ